MSKEELDPFISLVYNELAITVQDFPTESTWGGTGTSIGALVLRLGLLNMDEINEILEEGESNFLMFGENAVLKNYLTQHQVDKILAVQKWNRRAQALELLYMADILEESQYKSYLIKAASF